MITTIVLFSVTLLYLALIFQLRTAWTKMPTNEPSKYIPDVSIVVVFRNEEDCIETLLNDISNLDSDGSNIEIILIDDDSTDSTVSIIQKWKAKHHISVVLESLYAKTAAHKKEGIELGMAHATNEFVVVTDADCKLPEHWLRTMITTNPKQLHCGPVCYASGKSTMSKILELEMISLSALAGSTIGLKKPILANGANLGYCRSLFFEIGGYGTQVKNQPPSGDDISLMREVHSRYSNGIRYVKNPDAIVETTMPMHFEEFFFQRLRWAGKTKFQIFKPGALIMLQLMAMYAVMLFVPLVLVFQFDTFIFLAWGICFALKLLADLWYFVPITKFFGKNHLLWYLPLAELLHLVYIIPMAILSLFLPYKWKGRTLRHG